MHAHDFSVFRIGNDRFTSGLIYIFQCFATFVFEFAFENNCVCFSFLQDICYIAPVLQSNCAVFDFMYIC